MRIPKTGEVRKLLKALDMEHPIDFAGDREKLREELKFLVELAKTNFAACFNANDPDDNTLTIAVSSHVPHMVTGGGQIVGDTCRWLRAKATNNYRCGAPAFITGCDNAVKLDGQDIDCCMCGGTRECPWTQHLETFRWRPTC